MDHYLTIRAKINDMSLLAQLAAKVEKLNTELAATEALGLMLQDRGTAEIFTQLVRTAVPELPDKLIYSTQAADSDGRPDLVGRNVDRECLHVEGKYWAGLTPKQSSGAYLDRMRRQHTAVAPDSAHVGALCLIVPPRRTGVMNEELARLFELSEWRRIGQLDVAATRDGLCVLVTSWPTVLSHLASSADGIASEDARQLLGLVEHIDNFAYIPWTVEDRTDQQTPRRLLRLASVIEAATTRLLQDQVAESQGRRQTITEGGPLAFGKRMKLGGVTCTLRLSLEYWARYGQTPLWLGFGSGADAARLAFEDVRDVNRGVVVPVPMPTGQPEHETTSELVRWLTSASLRLRAAASQVPPPASADDVDEED